MGKITLLLVLGVIITIGLTAPNSAFAGLPTGFQGDYDPANWTFFTEGDGTVDTTGAPDSIMLTGSDLSGTCPPGGISVPCPTDFTIPIPENGFVEFSWDYFTIDGPLFDRAGFLIDGEFFELTNRAGQDTQSGFIIIEVLKDETFGFRIDSTDDIAGTGAFTEISEFVFTPLDPAYVSGARCCSGPDLEPAAIGIVSFGQSGDINQIGGQVTIEAGLSGLTFDSNGNLFGSAVFGGNDPSTFYQIDPFTGEATLLGPIQVIEEGDVMVRDLATQPGTDDIFAVGTGGDGDVIPGCESFSSLFTIDPSDGTADCVGIFEVNEAIVRGIAFGPDGTLWAVGDGCFVEFEPGCGGNFLGSFNPDGTSAGFILELDDLLDGLGIRSSDGSFFGTGSTAFATVHFIDLETGETPAVAGFGESLSDITFLPFGAPAPTSSTGKGSTTSQDPNLGDIKNGQGHDNGFCMNQNCMNVEGFFNHFPETTVRQGSTQSFTVLVNCPRGADTCNHISLGGGLPDSDFYDDQWTVTVDRQPRSDNWDLTVYNPFGEIDGDAASVTVQPVGNSFVTATFNIPFLIPGSIGTFDGVGVPQENNRHLHVTVWDSNGGSSNYIFNEGIFVDDIYAYPQVETSFDDSIEYDQVCVNENINKRYSCGFDKVRELTIKNAEEKLNEIYDKNNINMDSYDESEQN